MSRLTAPEYAASVQALLDVPVTAPLPVDYRLHGFSAVGASELSIAPSDLERYEAAAWQVATDALPDAAARDVRLGCALDELEEPERCVGPWAAGLARRAWRRPVDRDDLELLLDVYDVAEQITGDRTTGARALVAAVLQSPWFLFRVEIGVPTDDPAWRRLSDHELAARLASLLTGAPPDAELLADADAGRLDDDTVLAGHVERLLARPEAEVRLAGFFREWMDLERLATVDKDVDRFPSLTPALREDMASELDALFVDVVLDRDVDMRTLLTTDRARVTPALAAHYGLDPVSEPTWISLPSEQERGGLLGRAGFLTVESHAAATSPTHRGLFVRTRLLCGTVSPPPAGIDTTLPEPDPDTPMTTRERLSQHADDPACRGCHQQMDPFGLALERYDAVGRYRTHENGLRIDATGHVGEVPVDGAAELGAALAADPELGACLVRQVYRHAIGAHESDGEEGALDELTGALVARDHRLKGLIVDLVLHEAFRHVAPPAQSPCAEEGATRPCYTDCGEGVRTCEDGHWRDCTATEPQPEVCNGVDDDCDGVVDEAVRTCEARLGTGLQACEDGEWLPACVGVSPRDETCNGVDDDGDGAVDEDLQVDVATIGFDVLTDAHAGCGVAVDAASGPCRAAIHRTCGERDCSVTGFGPVALDPEGGQVSLACLDSDEARVQVTSYTELKRSFEGCDAIDHRWGSHCNAAINRWCGSRGLTTGFGPIENSGDTAVVVCTPRAVTHRITYTTLAPFSDPDQGRCDGSHARLGSACDAAIHGYCRDQGFRTGHGPLENYLDDVHVACLGSLEEEG